MENFFLLREFLKTAQDEIGSEWFPILAEGVIYILWQFCFGCICAVLASTAAVATGSSDDPRRNLLIFTCYYNGLC